MDIETLRTETRALFGTSFHGTSGRMAEWLHLFRVEARTTRERFAIIAETPATLTSTWRPAIEAAGRIAGAAEQRAVCKRLRKLYRAMRSTGGRVDNVDHMCSVCGGVSGYDDFGPKPMSRRGRSIVEPGTPGAVTVDGLTFDASCQDGSFIPASRIRSGSVSTRIKRGQMVVDFRFNDVQNAHKRCR